MKFFDEVNISVSSGKGWDGVATGRREKNIPFWWPSGWDGGRGGSVFFVWDENERTLMPYRYNVKYAAKAGDPWHNRDQYGKDADNIHLSVPVGTLIKDTTTWATLAHITAHAQEIEICKGGRWWLGNIHFVTASNQFPETHLLWEPWQKKKLTLELQMLADVALIGTPSVGKSTIINAVSNVKAKTAEYHFTTLVPNIWVVEHKGRSFTMIDIPGLIAGASDGKWLGNEFLRHILKSRILCFVIDTSRFESGRPDFGVLLQELMQYVSMRDEWTINLEIIDNKLFLKYTHNDQVLWRKHIVWICNKSDIVWDDEILWEVMDWRYVDCRKQLSIYLDVSTELLQTSTFVISAATRTGVEYMLDNLRTSVENQHIISILDIQSWEWVVAVNESIVDTSQEMIPYLIEHEYLNPDTDHTKLKIRSITHAEICGLTYMIPWGNIETEHWYRTELQKLWLLTRLEDAGVTKWDILHIVSQYEWHADRYVLRE